MTEKNTHYPSQQPPAVNLDEPMYDKQDILQRFHISERTLLTWRKKNLLPHFRIGKKIYYPKKLVEEQLEKYRVR